MTPRELDAALARGKIRPVYLVIGDDEAGKDEVVARLTALVDEDLRAFNVERFHASEARPDDVVLAARTLPMLGERRVIIYLHVERLFKGKRKAAEADEEAGAGDADTPAVDPGGLEGYVTSPEPSSVLVLVGTDINRTTKLGKLLDAKAHTVACDGFEQTFGRPDAALRQAMQFAAQRFKAAGKRADAAALTVLVERAGPDIVRLRKDVDTLVLFVGDAPAVTDRDVRAVVGSAQQLDEWGVTNAIGARDVAGALRQVDLSLENGGVPFMLLGQLGWWVRSRMPQVEPGRVPDAVRAVYRADGAMKSGRSPRVVLERLVVELCGPGRRASGPPGERRPATPQRGR